jgi:hypothetical protein
MELSVCGAQAHGIWRKISQVDSLLLYTANTKVMVSGMPGERIYHARGLRHKDPTSPLLFVAGMEVMTAPIERESSSGSSVVKSG